MSKKKIVSRKGESPEKREVDYNRVVQGAIQDGIGAILEAHPKFKQYGPSLGKQLDQRKMKHCIAGVYDVVESDGKNWDSERKEEFVYKVVADYVASGRAFNHDGQGKLLEQGLKEKGNGKKSHLKGEKNVENALGAFRDLDSMMRESGQANENPEFYASVRKINEAGFLDSALDVFDSYGLINEKEKGRIRKGLRKRIHEEEENIESIYHTYLQPRRAAAIILSLFGITLIALSGKGITGNVIGLSRGDMLGSVTGFACIAISALMLFKNRK